MQNLTTCKQKKHSLLNLAFGREYHGILCTIHDEALLLSYEF